MNYLVICDSYQSIMLATDSRHGYFDDRRLSVMDRMVNDHFVLLTMDFRVDGSNNLGSYRADKQYDNFEVVCAKEYNRRRQAYELEQAEKA